MNIAETMVTLRKAHRLTQENVAQVLDVSIAAVSKWECGNAYPDIELLPKIAALFDVSVDYLFNYHRMAQKTLEEHIAHAYDLIRNRQNRAADEYMTDVLNRYPENNRVKIEAASIKRIRTCGTNETPHARELLLNAESILKSVNLRELSRRETDQYYITLADIYRIDKRFDDAAVALEEVMPAENINPEQQKYLLELDRGNTEDAIAEIQKLTFRAIQDIIVTSNWYYIAYANDPEKVIAQNLFVLRLLDAVTGGEASPFDRDLCYACECISYMYAKISDKDNAIAYFSRAMKYAVRFDGIETMTYTHLSPFSCLDETGLDFYPHGSGSLAGMTANIVAEAGEERREYALIRDTESIRAILADFQ